VGNFRDGEVGKKVRQQILSQFFFMHNPDQEFAEYMFRYDKRGSSVTGLESGILDDSHLENFFHVVKDRANKVPNQT
jgi:hypothetical protein